MSSVKRIAGNAWLAVAVGLVFWNSSISGFAADIVDAPNDFQALARLTLEDILNTEVTSVSKRPERLFEAAAAVAVISGEDIRRSGATSIAAALRLAPGMEVSQIDANKWAITSRGLNDFFADKLLVLMDGRTVYTPIFSGVYWDIQDYVLEDIDRIEVVRGPGATLWGANAVNGVVNIITKDAKDTQGLYFGGGTGTEERGFFDARYGAEMAEDVYVRVYANGHSKDSFPGGYDASSLVKTGFRADWHLPRSHLTLQGDYFSAESRNLVQFPNYATFDLSTYLDPFVKDKDVTSGGDVLFHFDHTLSEESDLQLQAYFDRVERRFFGTDNDVDIFDLEFKHRFPLFWKQSLMYGLGYRYQLDKIGTGPWFTMIPNARNFQIFNAFVQDEITIVDDRLKMTLGTKLEHNDYSNWEVQPTARMAWTPTERQTIWSAVSRAVQVPGRGFHDSAYPTYFPGFAFPFPNPAGTADIPAFLGSLGPQGRNLTSQRVLAYELGYRLEASSSLSFGLATFYNRYTGLLIYPLKAAPLYNVAPFPHYIWEFDGVNAGNGETYGFELDAKWHVTEDWRLSASYSLLREKIDEIVRDFGFASEGRDPIHQASLRSSMDLPGGLELDLISRYVDALPDLSVDSYIGLDARLAWWSPDKHLEIALVGQNLIEPRHFEFGVEPAFPFLNSKIPRGGYLQASIRY